jgi:hypothetical protein
MERLPTSNAGDDEMKTTIDMAREAGLDAWWDSGSDWRETFNEHLKAFEALVRADEREACAKVCEQYKGYGGNLFAPAIRNRGNT